MCVKRSGGTIPNVLLLPVLPDGTVATSATGFVLESRNGNRNMQLVLFGHDLTLLSERAHPYRMADWDQALRAWAQGHDRRQ